MADPADESVLRYVVETESSRWWLLIWVALISLPLVVNELTKDWQPKQRTATWLYRKNVWTLIALVLAAVVSVVAPFIGERFSGGADLTVFVLGLYSIVKEAASPKEGMWRKVQDSLKLHRLYQRADSVANSLLAACTGSKRSIQGSSSSREQRSASDTKIEIEIPTTKGPRVPYYEDEDEDDYEDEDDVPEEMRVSRASSGDQTRAKAKPAADVSQRLLRGVGDVSRENTKYWSPPIRGRPGMLLMEYDIERRMQAEENYGPRYELLALFRLSTEFCNMVYEVSSDNIEFMIAALGGDSDKRLPQWRDVSPAIMAKAIHGAAEDDWSQLEEESLGSHWQISRMELKRGTGFCAVLKETTNECLGLGSVRNLVEQYPSLFNTARGLGAVPLKQVAYDLSVLSAELTGMSDYLAAKHKSEPLLYVLWSAYHEHKAWAWLLEKHDDRSEADRDLLWSCWFSGAIRSIPTLILLVFIALCDLLDHEIEMVCEMLGMCLRTAMMKALSHAQGSDSDWQRRLNTHMGQTVSLSVEEPTREYIMRRHDNGMKLCNEVELAAAKTLLKLAIDETLKSFDWPEPLPKFELWS